MIDGLPPCPDLCGGPGAGRCPDLDPSIQDVRRRNGCDAPSSKPRYAITCPACNGTKLDCCKPCQECGGSGRKEMFRCPASYQTPEVSAALRAYAWREKGFLPAPGLWTDQDPSFLWFVNAFENEIAAAEREEELKRGG